ncbi:MAG TPA: hypothetical protein VNZ22_16990, partial [Bacillota bacterium]|nr:hypothetical protein [Bacillota bacterium]
MDYTLHYRSPRLMGMDADYSLSRAYYARGWPTFVVIGADRVVRFHGFDLDKNLSAVRKCLEELAPAAKPALQKGIAIPEGALASRQARRDRSPRLAFDRAGKPIVVYYSNHEGTNAVYWRRYNENGQAVGEERLSSPQAESYAADCAFDTNGTLWTVWCGRQDGNYDLFVQSRSEGAQPKTEQLTSSREDAMSPKIATGPRGV